MFVLAATLALGCSGSDDTHGDRAHAPASSGSSETFQCSSDPRVETYVANLEKAGTLGRAAFKLTSADPAPPRRGLNTWRLVVTDTSGAVIPQADVIVSGMMPDHQHGWSTAPTITKGEDGMTFDFAQLNLSMAGVWTVTFEVQTKSADGTATAVDRATFTFCIG
jgi:hypothetical protein